MKGIVSMNNIASVAVGVVVTPAVNEEKLYSTGEMILSSPGNMNYHICALRRRNKCDNSRKKSVADLIA